MIRRLLVAAAVSALLTGAVQVVLSQPAVAQSTQSLSGTWRGDRTTNQVRIRDEGDTIHVAAVTSNNGAMAEARFFRTAPGEYRYNFPQGGQAIVKVEGPDSIRVTYPDGWTDLFRPVVRASTPTPSAPRPSTPPPAAVDGSINPDIADAISAANDAAHEQLERMLNPAAAERPLFPNVVYQRREGGDCVDIEFTELKRESGTTWVTDFTVNNKCGYDVLIRVDTAERNVGDTQWTSYMPNGGVVKAGEPNSAVWPAAGPRPANLGFTPFVAQGEGHVPIAGWQRTYPLTVGAPRKEIGVWLLVCRLRDEATGRRHIMFVEKQNLRDGGKWFCVVSPPASP